MFFSSLSILEIVLLILASTATLILIIQIVLMAIGLGGGDIDFDGIDSVGDGIDADAGLDGAIFTLKGVIGFFSIGGWVGFALSRNGVSIPIVIIVAFLSGSAALVAVGYLYRLIMKLQSNGEVKNSNAIGLEGVVYLTIPPNGNGSGKVNVTVQERFIEVEAITYETTAIETNDMVKVVDCINDILVVEKI